MSIAFFAEVLKNNLEITGTAATDTSRALIDAMKSEIATNGSFNIPGFGTFRLVQTKARNGLNPRTGEPVKVPAGATIRFKASKTDRESLKKAASKLAKSKAAPAAAAKGAAAKPARGARGAKAAKA